MTFVPQRLPHAPIPCLTRIALASSVPDMPNEAHDLRADWGSRVRALRKRHGMTTRQLSIKSGVDQGNLSRIENGQQRPGESFQVQLAAALETTVADLFPAPCQHGQRDQAAS